MYFIYTCIDVKNMCIYLSIYLSTYLPIYLSIHPASQPSIHPSIHPTYSFIHLFIYPLIHTDWSCLPRQRRWQRNGRCWSKTAARENSCGQRQGHEVTLLFGTGYIAIYIYIYSHAQPYICIYIYMCGCAYIIQSCNKWELTMQIQAPKQSVQ